MRWIANLIVKLIKKIRFEIRCANADYPYKWLMIYEGCFLPSFYMRHTPEEAARIKREYFEELRKLLETLDDEDK